MRLLRAIVFTLTSACFSALLTHLLWKSQADHMLSVRVDIDRLLAQQSNCHNTDSPSSEPPNYWNSERMRLHFPIPTNVKEQHFTIVILTYNRTESLQKSLIHYGRFHNVRRILVIWNNNAANIPQTLTNQKYGAPVVFFRSNTNQLRNRFIPRREIETQGVLHTDDDIRISESDVNRAFYVWKNNSNLIIGSFTKRSDHRANGKFMYMGAKMGYNMVLTGHAFIHARFHDVYQQLPTKVLRFIDEKHNCEDIALNYAASSLCNCTGCLGVRPRSRVDHPIKVGLHIRPAHYTMRSQCCALFAQEFELPKIQLLFKYA